MIINTLLAALLPFLALNFLDIPQGWIFVSGIVEGLLVARLIFSISKWLRKWLQ